MFFLVPRIALILFVIFGVLLAWRAFRQRRLPNRRWLSRWRLRRGAAGAGSPRNRFSRLPLVPAAVLRGADRTWVVFATPDSGAGRAIAERLRRSEPASQVTEIDARREPRLAEAFQINQVPALIRANRYGQVEDRLIGPAAVESALAQLGASGG